MVSYPEVKLTSVLSEQVVLAAVLKPGKRPRPLPDLHMRCFTQTAHRWIWRSMVVLRMMGAPVTPAAVASWLKYEGRMDNPEVAPALQAVVRLVGVRTGLSYRRALAEVSSH